MHVFVTLVLWVHLISLALAGAAMFGVPAIFTMMAKAPTDQRPVFRQCIAKLAAFGRMALALMILSGLVLIYVKLGGFSGLSGWFHLKMLLVLALLGLAFFNVRNAKKAQAGDASALNRMPQLAKIAMFTFAATVLSAAFAFN